MFLGEIDLSRYKKEDFKRIASYIGVIQYPVIMELIKNPDLRDLIKFFFIGLEEMCAKDGHPLPPEVREQIGSTISTALLYGIMAGEAKQAENSELDMMTVH